MDDLDVRILTENLRRDIRILGNIPMEHVLVNQWEEVKTLGEELLRISKSFKRQYELMETGSK